MFPSTIDFGNEYIETPDKFGSKPEERVFVVLVQMQERGEILGFTYQVPLFGGRTVRGGVVLDFLVRAPMEVAVMVQGSYWHEGELDPDERLVIARLQNIFDKVVQLWEPELDTIENAERAIREKVL